MIYLHKILPLIFSPLIIIILLIIFGLITGSKKISLIGVFILIVCSLPVVSDKLVAYLESDYQLSKPSSIEPADAIVVLSGMIKRCEIAIADLKNPDVLCIDEPKVYLDENGIQLLLELLKKRESEGNSTILSSQESAISLASIERTIDLND